MLYGEEKDKFWDYLTGVMKTIVSGNQLDATLQKMGSFKASHVTALRIAQQHRFVSPIHRAPSSSLKKKRTSMSSRKSLPCTRNTSQHGRNRPTYYLLTLSFAMGTEDDDPGYVAIHCVDWSPLDWSWCFFAALQPIGCPLGLGNLQASHLVAIEGTGTLFRWCWLFTKKKTKLVQHRCHSVPSVPQQVTSNSSLWKTVSRSLASNSLLVYNRTPPLMGPSHVICVIILQCNRLGPSLVHCL